MCHRTDESDIDSIVTTKESERSSIEPNDFSGSTSSTTETENESDIEEQSVSGSSSTSGLPLSPPTNLTPKGFVYSICMI
jgi:hypothetical protein